MKLLAPLIFLGLILLGVFTLINWGALNTPADLSFIVLELRAPLGLVLVGAIVVFVALFTAYVLVLRTAMLMDAHRYAKELKAQQQLAEQAEASRLSELRSQIDHEFAQLQVASDKSRIDINTRLDAMEQGLRTSIEESGRSLSAYVGEVEDKLDRSLGQVPPNRLS